MNCIKFVQQFLKIEKFEKEVLQKFLFQMSEM